jgi:hypothetical protein
MSDPKKVDCALVYLSKLEPTLQTTPNCKLSATLPLASVEAANAAVELPTDFAIYSDSETGGKFLNTLALVPIVVGAVQEVGITISKLDKSIAGRITELSSTVDTNLQKIDENLKKFDEDTKTRVLELSAKIDAFQTTSTASPTQSVKQATLTAADVQRMINAKQSITALESKKIAESVFKSAVSISQLPKSTPTNSSIAENISTPVASSAPAAELAITLSPELEIFINELVTKKVQDALVDIQKQIQHNATGLSLLNTMFRDIMPN